MPYIVSAVFSPILGWYVDNYGHRMTIMLIGSLLIILAHAQQLVLTSHSRVFAFTSLFLSGLSYTTYAVVLWGSFPYIVEAHTLGTAFGFCTSLQNLGTVIAPIIMGFI